MAHSFRGLLSITTNREAQQKDQQSLVVGACAHILVGKKEKTVARTRGRHAFKSLPPVI